MARRSVRGAAVENRGKLKMNRVVMRNTNTTAGGGVLNYGASATLEISNSSFYANGKQGAGIYSRIIWNDAGDDDPVACDDFRQHGAQRPRGD